MLWNIYYIKLVELADTFAHVALDKKNLEVYRFASGKHKIFGYMGGIARQKPLLALRNTYDISEAVALLVAHEELMGGNSLADLKKLMGKETMKSYGYSSN
jgi:hypothetical protein